MPRFSEPSTGEPRGVDPRILDTLLPEDLPEAPTPEALAPDARTGESRGLDPRSVDPRGVGPRIVDHRTVETRTAARRAPAGHGSHPGSSNGPTVYRARRPGVAALLIILAGAAGVLLVRGLAISVLGTPSSTAGVLACCLALAALPLLASGLYGLITGAAHGAEQWGFRIWARPPLAYLVVGLVFVVAAGLAIG